MEVPGLMGYQSVNAPMMNYNMVPQQQAAAVPELQTANLYPAMGKNQTSFNWFTFIKNFIEMWRIISFPIMNYVMFSFLSALNPRSL